MTESSSGERVRRRRVDQGWTQGRLAEEAGISRTAVSAIESDRLSPSVQAALAIARALGASVEELFGDGAPTPEHAEWAWEPPRTSGADPYWSAEIGGRTLRYPIETTAAGRLPHDAAGERADEARQPERTLVVATCDPAAGLLADRLRASGTRAIVLLRSSREALELLGKGLIHVAGVHYANADRRETHERVVSDRLGSGFVLLRGADWETGVAATPTAKVRRPGDALRAKLRWVGREPGSSAADRIAELFEDRPLPRRFARSHRGVAEAIRDGFADAGVTLRLTCEEAGLDFLRLRRERYDFVFPVAMRNDRRLRALVDAVRSAEYRRSVAALAGYDARETGESAVV